MTKYNQAANLLIPSGIEYSFLSKVSVFFTKSVNQVTSVSKTNTNFVERNRVIEYVKVYSILLMCLWVPEHPIHDLISKYLYLREEFCIHLFAHKF